MSDEDALNAAKAFISEFFKDVIIKETYYVTDNGMMTINFAASQDNVILYPDLIKIGVALDNGEILFYEATGYLQNHTQRALPKDIISRSEAEKAVSPILQINSSGLAVILTDAKKEVYCYEFKCANAYGKEYLVYVDAETGRQENMLVIIDTGRGKLVM
jgi:germination protein YpeB